MMREAIKEKVVKALKDFGAVTDSEGVIEEDQTVNDLELDSLDMVEVVMELEEAFDIVIEDEDAEKVKTVANLIDLIDNTHG